MASTFQLTSEEVLAVDQVNSLPKPTTIDLIGGIYCYICDSIFHTKKEYDSHYIQHDSGGKEMVYSCVVCRKQFDGYPSFRGHCYLKHVNKDRFKCEHCNKMFSKLTALTKHVAAMHTFVCLSCDQKFPTKNELVMHQIVHKVQKSKLPHSCYSCGENIDNIDMCELHIEEHSTTQYPCPICEEVLPSKPEAIQHLSKHYGDVLIQPQDEIEPIQFSEDSSLDVIGGIQCCYCDELYKTRIDFDLHFVTEHGDKELVYSCIMCNKKFDKYSTFGNHCYSHLTKDKFECDECGRTFPRLSLLVVHTEAFHPDGAGGGDKPFTCTQCGHSVACGKSLRVHWRAAHRLERAACPQRGCTRAFSSPHALLLHAREHAPARAACRQCGLRLPSSAAAARHLPVHRLTRYTCPVCERAYREKHLLVKHVPQHFEAVLHVCKVCGKWYDARSRLREHVKQHSVVRSYTCTYCGKGFVKQAHLDQHMNVHTGRRPYKCTDCPKAFASYPNWAKHLMRMHNVDHKKLKKKFPVEAETKDNLETVAKPVMMEHAEMDLPEPADIELPEPAEVVVPPVESLESTLDDIDPHVIERELRMICDNNNCPQPCIDFEFDDMLPADTAMPVPEPVCVPVVPREYGPEFVNQGATAAGAVIDLDDHIMPHIDPLLTIKNDWQDYQQLYPPLYQPIYQQLYQPQYDELADASRTVLTDIF